MCVEGLTVQIITAQWSYHVEIHKFYIVCSAELDIL